MQGIDVQTSGSLQIVAQVAEVSSQQNMQIGGNRPQLLVGLHICLALLGSLIEHQAGFVQLDPVGAGLNELA